MLYKQQSELTFLYFYWRGTIRISERVTTRTNPYPSTEE